MFCHRDKEILRPCEDDLLRPNEERSSKNNLNLLSLENNVDFVQRFYSNEMKVEQCKCLISESLYGWSTFVLYKVTYMLVYWISTVYSSCYLSKVRNKGSESISYVFIASSDTMNRDSC